MFKKIFKSLNKDYSINTLMKLFNLRKIYKDWITPNQKTNYKMKIGAYVENLFLRESFNKFEFYFLISYLFLYELSKYYEILQNLLFNCIFKNNIECILKPLLLENHLFNINKSTAPYECIFSVFIIQFLLSFYILYDFFNKSFSDTLNNYIYNNSLILRLINIILFLFSHSFNYINIRILIYLDFESTLNIITYSCNIFVFVWFNIVFTTYLYLYNDISPTKNKFFFSVSNPIFHLITYFQMMLFNIIIIIPSFLPVYLIFLLIVAKLILFLHYTLEKIYIINSIYYFFIIGKIIFFLSFILINIIFYSLRCNMTDLLNFHMLIISLIICFIIIPSILTHRENYFYKKNKKYEIINDNYTNELYIYHLLSKENFDQKDLFKHRSICIQFSLEECLCKSHNKIDINNPNLIRDLKIKTCLLLSKLAKDSTIIHINYLKALLDQNQINHALFAFLLQFKAKDVEIYKYHLIIRNVKKFIEIYMNFYDNTNNRDVTNTNLTLTTLSQIVHYEFIFRKFVKNIKSAINTSLNFWEVIENKPIDNKLFFKYGLEISSKVISISQDFGKLQNIQPNKILLLKFYAYFLKAVLHDKEYVENLLGIMKENIQMYNPNGTHNYVTNDFGLLIISGESNGLFKILSHNKSAKLFFGETINLKNQNIHNLQPFPFNLIHLQYLKHKFDISYLSKERVLYCLDQNADLKFFTTNTLPCMNIDGKINFFMLFYISKEHSNPMTALVDKNGSVFAATRSFKEEFGLEIQSSFSDNCFLFENFNSVVNVENINFFNYVDIIKNGELTDIIFPFIYDYIKQTKKIIKGNYSDYGKTVIRNHSTIYKLYCLNNHLNKKEDNSKVIMNVINVDNCNNSSSNFAVRNDSNNKDIFSSIRENEIFKDNYNENLQVNEKTIFTGIVEENFFKYKIEIIRKTVLSGWFTYFSIKLNKLMRTSLSKESIFNYEKNLIYNPSSDLMEFKKDIQNDYLEDYFENKNNITSFLTKYQNNCNKITSPSKIFKKIYILLGIPFFIMITISIYISCRDLTTFQSFIESCKIFNGFSFIKYQLILLLNNLEYFSFFNFKFSQISLALYNQKSISTKNSIKSDLEKINTFIIDFMNQDLSSSPSLRDAVQSRSFKLGYLTTNNDISYNYYSFYQALNIYLQKFKEYIVIEENTFTPNDFFVMNITISELNSKEKDLIFLHKNYYDTFRPILEEFTHARIEICKLNLRYFNNWIMTQNIIFGCSYIIIFIVFLIIWKYVYEMDSLLIKLYYKINDQYIINSIDFLKHSKANIFKFNQPSQKTPLLTSLSFKSIHGKLDKKQTISIIDDNLNKQISKKNTKNSFCNNSIIINNKRHRKNSYSNNTVITNGTEANLINKPEKFLLYSPTNQNLIQYTKIFDLKANYSKKEEIRDFKYDSFYLSKFSKVILLLFSLSYFYIIIIFIHIYSTSAVDNYVIHQYTLHRQTVVYNLIIGTILSSIKFNSPLLDENKQELFKTYFQEILSINRDISNIREDRNFFTLSMKQDILSYNSPDFCEFFFNKKDRKTLINETGFSYIDCINSDYNLGINMYMTNLKNSLRDIYDKFKHKNNRTTHYLNEIIEDDSIQSAHLFLQNYLRTYREDIHTLFWNSYNKIVFISSLIIKSLLSVFLLQLCIMIYVLFFKHMKDIYFHFEKKRILLSILPRSESDDSNIDKKFLLFKYF